MNDDFALLHFHPMRRRLFELARSLLGTSADAEDAVQDAWLRVHGGVPSGLKSAEAWLMTVVRHLAIDQLRRRRLDRAWRDEAGPLDGIAPQATAPSAESMASHRLDGAAALRRITDALAPGEAAALLLHEVFDVDYAAIARSAGRTEAACRQMVRRAWRKVKKAPPERRNELDAETLFKLCWLAMQTHDAGVLHAVLMQPVVTALAVIVGDVGGRETAALASGELTQIERPFALVEHTERWKQAA